MFLKLRIPVFKNEERFVQESISPNFYFAKQKVANTLRLVKKLLFNFTNDLSSKFHA